jgi:cysteate synthase
MNPTKYRLLCPACGRSGEDGGYQIHCPQCGKDALLRSVYANPLSLDQAGDAFGDYVGWLPFENLLPGVGAGPRMAAFPCPELGRRVGLDDLWLIASAWAPEHGARFATGSFKETEALGVLSRVREQTDKVLIISSAGNAGRAFLECGLRSGAPVVVIVPQRAAPDLLVSPLSAAGVRPLLVQLRDAVYMDAIRFVDAAVAEFPERLVREGGAYNVARRDAMAVPFLNAVRRMGGLPDRYVQAVGSGTGALAAHEAALRLSESGIVAPKSMRLHLVQNKPFTPMVDAWHDGARRVATLSDSTMRERLAQVAAAVLSNATPPYAPRGGVYDALRDSGGTMDGVDNAEIDAARRLVQETAGFLPCPAAGAAAAGLIKGAREGRIGRGERVLLHLTGGGLDRLAAEGRLVPFADPFVCDVGDHAAAFSAIGDYLDRVAEGA